MPPYTHNELKDSESHLQGSEDNLRFLYKKLIIVIMLRLDPLKAEVPPVSTVFRKTMVQESKKYRPSGIEIMHSGGRIVL